MPSRIYRKKDTRVWYFRVVVRGQEIRRSLRTTDRKTAEKRAAVELERISAQRWGDDRHLWQEAVGRWGEEQGPALKPQTLRRYGTSLAVVAPVLEPLQVDEIDKTVLAKIASRPGVTNATRRRDLTAVSVILHAAEAWGWIDHVPTFPRRQIKERRDPILLPTPGEIEALHRLLSPMLSRLVRLLEQTGMRLEEAGSLTWAQVDKRRRTISLRDTKARRPREVPLSEDGFRTVSGTPRHMACEFVFWHSQDAPRRYGDLSGLLYDIRKRAGVPWRIHDLRHLFAVRYLQEGGSIYALQKILGHSTIAVTEGYLDYLTPEEQARAKGVA